MIDVLSQDYPITVTCKVLGCARSSYYYEVTEPSDEAKLKQAIKDVVADWPTYGYRRVTAQLRRQEWLVNHKRVQRLMGSMDIQARIKRKKRRTTNSDHDFPRYPNLVQDLEVVRPEQVWVSDITYIRLRYAFVYLAVIMDVFTRGIRGWHLGRGLDHSLTLTALQRALIKYPAPEIHHSDQGVQYAAIPVLASDLKSAGISIYLEQVKRNGNPLDTRWFQGQEIFQWQRTSSYQQTNYSHWYVLASSKYQTGVLRT